MTYEEIKKKIEACSYLGIVEEKETGNSKQLRLSNGAIMAELQLLYRTVFYSVERQRV